MDIVFSMRNLAFISAFCFALMSEAENITFADANVKSLCVANWDSDGDGELSMEEAASVTSLGSVFREKSNISTFDELKFFTGLTSIDDYAFYKSSISGQLVIPGNVKTIGDYAFNACQQLTSIILEEGVESVGWHTFSGPIRTLSLPASLTNMKSMAVDPYVNADPASGIFIPKGDLTVIVRSLTPPAINDFAFYYVFSDGHLIVPFGTVDAYKAVPGWSHFGEYLQAGDVNGDGALNVKDVVSLSAHIMGNRPSPFDERLADVNGDGKVNVKDVTLVCNWIMQRNQNQD